MNKQYHFTIDYLDTRYNQRGRGAVAATSILDAKNRFKSLNPTYKIIACVRGSEITSQKNTIKSGLSHKNTKEKENSSSLTNTLISAAVGVGIGWFLKKK